ncbi:hypothetical protein, partial [Bacteroides thetaiotaomicron]|uniref:hypothetical protein n=1 Tax=Bacteroides thetaiotaomicron TaxID=818 RepID=UPI002330112E
LFSLLMLILFASISYYARSCGFEVLQKPRMNLFSKFHVMLHMTFIWEQETEELTRYTMIYPVT